MSKYTVEIDDRDELRSFEVVEWNTEVPGSRCGRPVFKSYLKSEADVECSLLNAGYEYATNENYLWSNTLPPENFVIRILIK